MKPEHVENTTNFLVYCIEIYKTRYKISGREVIQVFGQNGILDYIVECYGALHTTGPEYIIEDIAGLIGERKQVAESRDKFSRLVEIFFDMLHTE